MPISDLTLYFSGLSITTGVLLFSGLASIVLLVAYIKDPNYVATPINFIRDAFNTIFNFFKEFSDRSPKLLQAGLFLLMILAVGNIIISPFLSNFVICDVRGFAWQPRNILSNFFLTTVVTYQNIANATNINLLKISDNNPIGNRENYVEFNPTIPNIHQANVTHNPLLNIGCDKSKTILRLYTLPILDYKLWAMLFLVIGIITLFIKLRSNA